MPLQNNETAGLIMDPDFFGAANTEQTGPGKGKPDISFLQGPKTKQKPVRIKAGGDDGYLASQLKWVELVADREVLKSDDRTRLKNHLDELIAGLNLRYIEGETGAFPSNVELAKLTEVIFALAKLIGVRKSDFGDLLGAVKRVENRLSKVSLLVFANALLDRLCQVPASPVSVVRQAAERSVDSKTTLEAIMKFLNGEMAGDNTTPWENWYLAIKQLQFPTSALMSSGSANLLHSADSPDQRKLLAYLLLMDLRRQQLEWDAAYGRSTVASLKWIYLLQRPEDFTRLARVYWGTALAPDKMTESINVLGNRERRNRSYKKSLGKGGRTARK